MTERDISTYLYGRRIYEMMTGWENDPELAADSLGNAEFAAIRQAAEKVVFSRSLQRVSTTRTRLEREFEPDLVRSLVQQAPGDLCVSGADLAASAWRAGLIDECKVFVAPVLVGGGLRMFPGGVSQPLELADERRFGDGMVCLSTRSAVDRPAQDLLCPAAGFAARRAPDRPAPGRRSVQESLDGRGEQR